ncbi:hypothetical protein CSB08_01240 [Candidatus Gracilibacteria bacterium]|nr:MAG: hypothetical protein CSB08_01240 [Candidatus Gracilibacteria bacterium]PIE85405.1 MAG: hypothetical protein CSA08_02405 [Candidatus Gracilibacteria bacterium]
MITKVIFFSIFYSMTLFIFVISFLNSKYNNINYSFINDNSNLGIIHSIIIFFASALLIKYFIYMLLAPWYDFCIARKYSKIKYSYKKKPKVSVLIPAWNEEVGIVGTIKSVFKNNYPNIEIIVVNDGSTDRTEEVILEYIKKNKSKFSEDGKTIVYEYKENGGKGKALNRGIEIATGDIILSIDADCLVDKDAVGSFVRYFDDPEVMAAVGNVKIGDTTSFIGIIQYLEFLFSFYFKKTDALLGTIYIIGGAAGAFRREVFQELGNYCTMNITEDIELSMRIQDAGYKIAYAPDAIIYTEPASDVKGLISQRFRWKIGRIQTFVRYKKMFFSRKNQHNKILSFIVLPYSIFGELQLSLEFLFLGFLYLYAFSTGDLSVFVSGVFIVGFMFFVQVFFDDKKMKNIYKIYMLLLSFIGWILFYVTTYVEVRALIRSIKTLIFKKEVVWQKWSRKGIKDSKS